MKRTCFVWLLFLLSACTSTTTVHQRFIDGEIRNFAFNQDSSARLVGNEWAQTSFISPITISDPETKTVKFQWLLMLKPKIKNISVVGVYDVSTEPHKLVMAIKHLESLSTGDYVIRSTEVPFDKKSVPWFFVPNDTEYIFKIIMTDTKGRKSAYYQPCFIPAVAKTAHANNI